MTAIDIARRNIAARACAQLGTPFRLFGRSAGKALDCVGLALVAAGPHWKVGVEVPPYRLRGDFSGAIMATLGNSAFARMHRGTECAEGDIAIVAPGPKQLHFMVCTTGGWVHADAGIGRVVCRPGPLPWRLDSLWRLNGI